MDLLKEKLKAMLKRDTESVLIASKIDNMMIFEEKEELQARSKIKSLKKDNMGVHIESIKK